MRTVRRTERGAAAVETALVLPVLLLLVFGIIDFGRMLNAQLTVTEAAREAARAMVLDADWEARVDVAAAGLGGSDQLTAETLVPCPADPEADDDAEITLEYTFEFVTPVGAIAAIFAGEGFGDDVTLQGVGVMPCRA